MSDKNMFDAAIRSIARDKRIAELEQQLLEANAHIERLSDQRTLDVRMKEAGMITLTEIWSGLPIDDFIKTNEVTTLEYFGRWLESRYKEASTMFAKRTVNKQEDDELYEWVLAHNAVFKEVLLNFNQVKQSPAQHTAEHDAEVARRNK
tara:strand:- start:9 stop:455 length:447 start_codon:yes stop_codon:yes gene_type:complete